VRDKRNRITPRIILVHPHNSYIQLFSQPLISSFYKHQEIQHNTRSSALQDLLQPLVKSYYNKTFLTTPFENNTTERNKNFIEQHHLDKFQLK